MAADSAQPRNPQPSPDNYISPDLFGRGLGVRLDPEMPEAEFYSPSPTGSGRSESQCSLRRAAHTERLDTAAGHALGEQHRQTQSSFLCKMHYKTQITCSIRLF